MQIVFSSNSPLISIVSTYFAQLLSQDAEAHHVAAHTNTLLKGLKELANQKPYYKYNGIWSRHMESVSFAVLFMGWIGLLSGDSLEIGSGTEGTLLTYEEVARHLEGTCTSYAI
jgi:Translin family